MTNTNQNSNNTKLVKKQKLTADGYKSLVNSADFDEPLCIPNKMAGRCIKCHLGCADFETGLCLGKDCILDYYELP